MFRVFFTSRADKELSKLPSDLKQKIYEEIKILSEIKQERVRIKDLVKILKKIRKLKPAEKVIW